MRYSFALQHAGGSSGNSDRPLGWISDSQGIPCITGERKTNAPAFLTQRIGVMALEAAGEAAAQAETTTLISDSGTATSVVSGETGQYVLGKALSGGSDEVAQWLRERQAKASQLEPIRLPLLPHGPAWREATSLSQRKTGVNQDSSRKGAAHTGIPCFRACGCSAPHQSFP